jgi:hypothetical protein
MITLLALAASLGTAAVLIGAAHRAGLVHGDLSPQNVFVSRDLSVVKVGESGAADIAQAEGSTRTAALARARVGSLLYRAPELAGDIGGATVCSDIYSLGVVAYEAMTGKLPVGKFSLPSDINNQVPLELDPIVLRCLATDPAQRYQTIAAFEADLDKVEEVVDYRLLNELKRLSGGRLFAGKEAPKPGRSRPARTPLYLGLAAVALIALAVIGALLLGVLFAEAQALIKGNQELEARKKLASIGERYSQSRWFVPAMMVKIDIEDRRALQEFDPILGKVAASSVQTKRLLTQRAPLHPTAEAALAQLGETYDGMKQYALAAESFVQLGTRFPNTRLDAWFRAGEITERRLKNREEARAAYLKVPPASQHYQEAQERARKQAGR